jgi:polyphosphate kinase 2
LANSARGGSKRQTGGGGKRADSLPAVLVPDQAAPVVTTADGVFNLDDPRLPDWIARRALRSGGYPYDTTLKDKDYERELEALQIELVKLQRHVTVAGRKVIAVFEGRDAGGKGGSIFALRQYMNPRTARLVALPKPTERERGQWYFQRYVDQLPTGGELVLFDRSWYNRGGVEPVMGFCTAAERRIFLAQTPAFEKMLVDDGAALFKFWLDIGREMQLKRFHERRHNPLKIWKLSPIDIAALSKWDDYTRARDAMLAATHRTQTPWTIVLANDKHRARLNVIRHLLGAIDYPGKDGGVVGDTDPLILGGPEVLGHPGSGRRR